MMTYTVYTFILFFLRKKWGSKETNDDDSDTDVAERQDLIDDDDADEKCDEIDE